MYSQFDDAWRTQTLGDSNIYCCMAGCQAVSFANALLNAGYADTPADVIQKLNDAKAIVYPAIDQIDYGILESVYSQIRRDSNGDHAILINDLACGDLGIFTHYCLRLPNGDVIESDGTKGLWADCVPKGELKFTVTPA